MGLDQVLPSQKNVDGFTNSVDYASTLYQAQLAIVAARDQGRQVAIDGVEIPTLLGWIGKLKNQAETPLSQQEVTDCPRLLRKFLKVEGAHAGSATSQDSGDRQPASFATPAAPENLSTLLPVVTEDAITLRRFQNFEQFRHVIEELVDQANKKMIKLDMQNGWGVTVDPSKLLVSLDQMADSLLLPSTDTTTILEILRELPNDLGMQAMSIVINGITHLDTRSNALSIMFEIDTGLNDLWQIITDPDQYLTGKNSAERVEKLWEALRTLSARMTIRQLRSDVLPTQNSRKPVSASEQALLVEGYLKKLRTGVQDKQLVNEVKSDKSLSGLIRPALNFALSGKTG